MTFAARLWFLILCLALPSTAFAQSKPTDPIELVPNFIGSGTYSSAFSGDGRYAVVGGRSGEVSVWEVRSGRKLRSFWVVTTGFGGGGVDSVAFSPDGSRVAAAARHAIYVWEVRTGASLWTAKAHNVSVNALAFLPDGSKLLSGGGMYTRSDDPFDSPLKLWDAQTGQLTRSFKGHTENVRTIALSKDGTTILSAGDDKTIKLWNAASGQPIQTFKGHKDKVTSVRFMPDGKTVLSESRYDKTARFWDVQSGRMLRQIPGSEYGSAAVFPDGKTLLWPPACCASKPTTLPASRYDIASGKITGQVELPFDWWEMGALDITPSPDGKLLLVQNNRVVDAATGKLVASFLGRVLGSGSVHSAPTGSALLVGGSALTLWDTTLGQLIQNYDEKSGDFAAWVSADGSQVISANRRYQESIVRLRDTTTGQVISEFDISKTIPEKDFSSAVIQLSPDNKTYAIMNHGGKIVYLVSAETKKVLHKLPDHTGGGYYTFFTFSPDSMRILTTTTDKKDIARLWDVKTGELLRTHKLIRESKFREAGDHQIGARTPGFSPDGKRVVTSGGNLTSSVPNGIVTQWGSADGTKTNNVGTVWDPETGQVQHHLSMPPHWIVRAAFSPDSTRLISGGSDRILRMWNAQTGEQIRTFGGNHGDNIEEVSFSRDGKRVFSTSDDATLKIWNADTGDLLATLVRGRDGAWMVLTPEGFFNASPNASDLLSIVQGMEAYSIEQVYQSLYRPDLVREKLAGDPRGLVREAAARLDLGRVIGSGNVPGVAIIAPQDGAPSGAQVAAEVDIVNRGGGIGRVEWRVNGVTVGVDTPPAPAANQLARLTRNLSLDPGSNTIEVIAYNAANLVASIPVRATVTVPSAAPAPGQPVAAQPSRLFVIAAGIDDYTDSRFKLAGSVRDARTLSQAFSTSGAGLYQSVNVKLLTDADVTKDKLDAAFKEFAAQATPADVFVLHLAGHGKTVDGRYYFVPRDFKVGNNSDEKAVNAAVVAQGIAQEQWQRWFATIPARKSMILFDTCESGSLTGDAAQTKALEQSAANDRLAQATGRSIITASSSTQLAFEYRGHGLFTYNLLDAMERADSDGNGTIEINELAAYVYAQVTRLSEQVFKKRQEPQIRIASSYPLTRQGRVLAGDLPTVAEDNAPAFQLAQTANLQIKPGPGATVVRSLNAQTAVTVLKSEGGWSLVASGGKPLGYVATRDLAPAAKAATR
ncbi:MAG: hypothetical protein A4S14_09245 [Proteobacteria bacterium SG_bin9]|nr:MAG: hypothetical protein A4S14_09245 [Proteobacteria bacterium SG_bin9]